MKAQEQLITWIQRKHHGQLIKKTKKPYFLHLERVATQAANLVRLGYEIGLCHDLLEDTPTGSEDLLLALIQFGYHKKDAEKITSCVIELTDVFTASAYPYLSKHQRKKLEAIRLISISPDAQTLKYADLIDNIAWVAKHDKKNAARYLKKKQQLLMALNKGNEQLRQQALSDINKKFSAIF